MKTKIEKTFTSLKRAERFQNSLYGRYDYVRLVRFPRFGEAGTYCWEVS